MHNFVVTSNDSTCIKSWFLGLDQVLFHVQVMEESRKFMWSDKVILKEVSWDFFDVQIITYWSRGEVPSLPLVDPPKIAHYKTPHKKLFFLYIYSSILICRFLSCEHCWRIKFIFRFVVKKFISTRRLTERLATYLSSLFELIA